MMSLVMLQAPSNDVLLIKWIKSKTFCVKTILIVYSKAGVALLDLPILSNITFFIFVYKKKIQIFVMNMTFISSREVKKIIYFICGFTTHEIYYIFSLLSIK